MQKYSWVKKGVNAAASGCVLNSCIPLKGRKITLIHLYLYVLNSKVDYCD